MSDAPDVPPEKPQGKNDDAKFVNFCGLYSLGDNHIVLCIVKSQAGQSPPVFRLQLKRVASRDGEEKLFGLQRGHEELMDIIEAAQVIGDELNEPCH
ncbi:hypothetical protein K4K49_012386 [Colletotrichum sp. SAR 10_70]|nr:hypothetical protein K4K50_007565 [Colletotrichum sp. SAR 10_71]KAI8201910.1 hypothetical protein K4K49_012386 [Colletotrichum sp. SAR 10_70]